MIDQYGGHFLEMWLAEVRVVVSIPTSKGAAITLFLGHRVNLDVIAAYVSDDIDWESFPFDAVANRIVLVSIADDGASLAWRTLLCFYRVKRERSWASGTVRARVFDLKETFLWAHFPS